MPGTNSTDTNSTDTNGTDTNGTESLDTQVAAWRAAMLRSRAVTASDADELEAHLRDQIADLTTNGLSDDEAFLIAVKRLGQVDALTAEYAREHGDRLWKHLVTSPAAADSDTRRSVGVMIAFAAVAVVMLHTARLLAIDPNGGYGFFSDPTADWFVRSLALFVLPVLGAYFAYTRRIARVRVLTLAAVIAVIGVIVNVFPYPAESDTQALVALHLPILLWFLIGAAYVSDLRSAAARMDFIRFTGEWGIYFLLIVLGGGLLIGLTTAILSPILPDAIDEIITWVMPAGGAAAVVVAAWLVEAKKSIIENLAPVLTAIFTPLFAALLLIAAIGYGVLRPTDEFDRDLLVVFDVLLIVVVGLVVYGISARDSEKPRGVMDALRFVAVVAAIILDVLVLVLMFTRVGELGFTPNRVAALGLNLVLLVNLLGTAWLAGRHLAGRARPVQLERWQTDYLPVFAGWVAVVVLVLPPVFLFR